MRRGLLPLALLALALAGAMSSRAQTGLRSGLPLPAFQSRPLLIEAPPPAAHVRRTTLRPLDLPHLERLRRAQALRERGLLEGARDTLARLLAEVPHHPLILSELARTQLALQEYAAVERLATLERAAQKDSLLLAQELVEAQERLGRPTEAAKIAIESWAAAPEMADWAQSTLSRLPADARASREALRQAVKVMPGRGDLARGLAQLEWRAGDARAMVQALESAERNGGRGPLRWTFAEELLHTGIARDTTGALEALISLAADPTAASGYRNTAAQRAFELARPHAVGRDVAPRLAHALADLPADRWDSALRVAIARALREAGLTAEARALLDQRAGAQAQPPEFGLERALADLRDGPPERVLPALSEAAALSPEGAYRYAEALFFAGHSDSARTLYDRLSKDAAGPYAGAALERLFLIEDASPKSALDAFGRIAYQEWRGDTKRASQLADSLYRALPRGPMWAEAALMLSAQREAAGDARAALEPLLAVADSLEGDRLAPRARQKAGDLYLSRLKDEAHAIEQYEKCLERYPRAWNAPEVRRKLEQLRHQPRP